MNRREFVVGSAAAGLVVSAPRALSTSKQRIKAIAFDAFAIFDPRSVFALAEEIFPGQAADLSSAWRARQFEYTWLRNSSQRYEDFWKVTEDALVFAARTRNLELTAANRTRLMAAYLELKPWPDAIPALKSIKDAGIRLAFLSNFSPRMLHAGIKNAGLEGSFEHVLSTDRVKTCKPSPRAYQMGEEAFRLKRSEILFVAFAGWDAAGAGWFGYPTFWANRLQAPAEELGITPDAMGANLNDLVDYLEVRYPK